MWIWALEGKGRKIIYLNLRCTCALWSCGTRRESKGGRRVCDQVREEKSIKANYAIQRFQPNTNMRYNILKTKHLQYNKYCLSPFHCVESKNIPASIFLFFQMTLRF